MIEVRDFIDPCLCAIGPELVAPLLAGSLFGGGAAAGAGAGAAGGAALGGIGSALAAGAVSAGLGIGANLLMSKTGKPDTSAAPPGLIPTTTPGAKPQRRSMQQSFLSGAAASGLPGGGAGSQSQGKTLLGQ